jgi:hypothetical protein
MEPENQEQDRNDDDQRQEELEQEHSEPCTEAHRAAERRASRRV